MNIGSFLCSRKRQSQTNEKGKAEFLYGNNHLVGFKNILATLLGYPFVKIGCFE